MKTFYLLITFLIVSSCSLYVTDFPIAACDNSGIGQNSYTKAEKLQTLMNSVVSNGVPGITMAVLSEEVLWQSAAGYAKIEDKTFMQPCHLHYLQSIAKLYLAVSILRLKEEKKINLDEPITKYLSPRHAAFISKASTITVRMLLNHTSGIPEYNSAPKYLTKLLQEPDYYFSPEEYLGFIDGKPLDYKPGSKYRYTNTNYLILALLADAITGDHAQYLNEQIFQPLGLKETYYRNDPNYLNYPNLVNSYWDRNSNGIIENVSRLQKNNVKTLIGDDGIVASPADALKFLQGLFTGKLISESSLNEMMQWQNDAKGKPTYGLGLDRGEFSNETGLGHSGGGIGEGCQLYFLPEKNVYFFIGVNLGTVTDSPIHEQVSDNLEKIYDVMLH